MTLAFACTVGIAAWSSRGLVVQHLGAADPLVSAGLYLAYGPPPRAPAELEPVTVAIDLDRPVRELDARFLSVAIDTSQLVGGHWWSRSGQVEVGRGAERVAPFDFSHPELAKLARALAPAYLRIGGTEADHLYYDFEPREVDAPFPPGYELALEPAVWDAVNAFASAVGFDLYFTLNAGPGPRAGAEAWQPDNAESLLRHARDAGQKIAVWELGNEVNGYWFIHGLTHQPNGAQYARDVAALRPLLKHYFPESRLAGPGSLFWPVLGEPVGFAFGILEEFLDYQARESGDDSVDIITWHYYPQQSRRCPGATRRATPERLLEPAYLDEVTHWASHVSSLRDRYAPGAEVWLGETGNAQCGGEPGVSDRFVGGLWWLDQLGLLARGGQSVVIRQTLAGSDYGLIDAASYRPNPDYWNSLLWKQLMGSTVLDVEVTGKDAYLRLYAHCAVGTGASTSDHGGSVALLALNTHPERSAEFRLTQAPPSALRFDLSARSLDSRELELNGKRLELAHGQLPELRGKLVELADGRVRVAPASYTFLVLESANAPACAQAERKVELTGSQHTGQP